MNTITTTAALFCIGDLPTPLSQRLVTMREQLSGMFAAGELDALDPDTRFVLRGLELALLDVSQCAFELEMARPMKPRRPDWLRYFVRG